MAKWLKFNQCLKSLYLKDEKASYRNAIDFM